MPALSVTLRQDLRLSNPILPASGTFGYAREIVPFFDPGRLGALIGKSVTEEPREGNAPHRVFETAAGMLNSIGLQNPGIEHYLAELHPAMTAFEVPVIVNVAGRDVAEYERLAERLDGVPDVAGIEVNLSCPNVKEGGTAFCHSEALLDTTVAAIRAKTRKPLLIKLSPNVTDIARMAAVAEAAGADALTVANTFVGLAVDWRRRRPRIAGGTGGLSGPAIKPLALRAVHESARAVKIPIVGCGGIESAEDVLEFLVAGARAVQIGTAAFHDPQVFDRVLTDLPKLLGEAGIEDVNEIVGTLQP